MDPTVETRLHRGDFPLLGIPVEGENEEPHRLVAVVLFGLNTPPPIYNDMCSKLQRLLNLRYWSTGGET